MTPIDMHTRLPKAMVNYLDNYGFHFSKKACEYAIRLMRKKNQANGEKESLEPWTKEQVESMLARYGIEIKHAKGYDHVFVANMAKADFYQSSIIDEQHLALFIKDYIDDVDGSDELAFRRWLASMVAIGEPIIWDDLL